MLSPATYPSSPRPLPGPRRLKSGLPAEPRGAASPLRARKPAWPNAGANTGQMDQMGQIRLGPAGARPPVRPPTTPHADPLVLGLRAGPKRRTLAAWVPKRGGGGALVPAQSRRSRCRRPSQVDPGTCGGDAAANEGGLSEAGPFTLALVPKQSAPAPRDGGAAEQLSWYLRCVSAESFATWEARLREACKPDPDAPGSETSSDASSEPDEKDEEDEEGDEGLEVCLILYSLSPSPIGRMYIWWRCIYKMCTLRNAA